MSGVWHPLDLPEGYHTASRGQSQMRHVPVSLRAAPGMPCGRTVSGRRDATRTPACKVIDDPPPTVSSLVGCRGMRGRPILKLLTKNQVLGGRTANRSEPANEECPRLHQLVHQRLRTTMDILGPEPNDEARPRTNCRYWRGAAYDYGSHGPVATSLGRSHPRHSYRNASP
jgi:hypothetical protein